MICVAFELGLDPAAVEDIDAAGEVQDLGQVGRDQHDRRARLAEVADEGVDRGAGADIDADRRLVEDEDVDRPRQAAGEQHLLLVAAGEEIDGALDAARLEVHAVGKLGRLLRLAGAVEEDAAREGRPVERGERDVLAAGAHHHQPLGSRRSGGM